MGEILYHEAKKLIESKIESYHKKLGSGEAKEKLPKIEINRSNGQTEVRFPLSSNSNIGKLAHAVVSSIGKMEIEVSANFGGTAITLTKDKSMIFLYDTYKEFSLVKIKESNFKSEEIDAVLQAYKISYNMEKSASPYEKLFELGVSVYDSKDKIGWDSLAGYEDIKRDIRDIILLPLHNPEIFDKIAMGTRKKYESIKPNAVLFEGPPGTGKTLSARIIAGESGCPMVYVPIESIMTKWYGESSRNLSKIFDACNDLEKSLIFLDEIDSLSTSREKGIYEATRRVLSVLLRKLDGFEQNNKTILIGATNRKQDLDPALISRFDASIYFRLPAFEERAKIFQNYAMQLDENDLEILARESEGFSGRNIKDVCEYAERKWASKILRKKEAESLPPLEEYMLSLKKRKECRI